MFYPLWTSHKLQHNEKKNNAIYPQLSKIDVSTYPNLKVGDGLIIGLKQTFWTTRNTFKSQTTTLLRSIDGLKWDICEQRTGERYWMLSVLTGRCFFFQYSGTETDRSCERRNGSLRTGMLHCVSATRLRTHSSKLRKFMMS